MEDQEPIECWLCSGPMGYQGTLGSVAHYQCRNCGSSAHFVESEGAAECQDVTPEIVTTPEDPS